MIQKNETPQPDSETSETLDTQRSQYPLNVNLEKAIPRSASSRYQLEVDAVIRSSANEEDLRSLLINCVIQNRGAVGAVWMTDDGIATERLSNPALQHQAVKNWIVATGRLAIDSGFESNQACPIVRNLTMITIPFKVPSGKTESLSLLFGNLTPVTLEAEILSTQSCVRAVRQWYGRCELRQTIQDLRTTAAHLELTSCLEKTQSLDEAARVLADLIQKHLNCNTVAVGYKRPGARTCRLQAISGVADFDRNSTQVRRIKAALDESLIRDELSVWPTSDDHPQHQLLAHRKLAETLHTQTVISVPLKNVSGETVGAVTVSGEESLNCADVIGYIATLDVPAGSSMSLVRRAQKSWLRRSCKSVLGSGGRRTVIVAAALAALVFAVLLVPMPYRIACRFTCEPVEKRYCVAPYEGLLQETLVEPGDVVKQGQIVALMDDRELRFELAGLAAEQHKARKEVDVYRARESIAQSYMAALDVDRVGSRSELLEHRLSSLAIRSGADGIVMTGPTERRENFPVKVGQMLYEIASLDPIRIQLAVPASEIDHIAKDMTVEFRADRDVSELWTGVIKRIRPRSEIVNDRNVFVAEVEFANPDGTLRPGMEGAARIISRSHPLGWNLFHKAWDFIVGRVLW